MDVFLSKAASGASARVQGPTDYRVLIATLQALQLSTATAKAGARQGAGIPAGDRPAPLTDILSGGVGWQDAVTAQQGCFNPVLAFGPLAQEQ